MQVLDGKLNSKILALVDMLVLIDCIQIFSAPFNGWIFTIDAKNLYHRGNLIVFHWIIIYAFELIPSIVAPFTKAEYKKKRAVMLFVVLSTITTVLQSMFYGVTSGQVGIMCWLILLYIMLQNIEVSEARTREELLDEISSTDTLTGLRNRRAYEFELEIKQKEEWIGVVFMHLVSKAEILMYKDKSEYYIRIGKNRRK